MSREEDWKELKQLIRKAQDKTYDEDLACMLEDAYDLAGAMEDEDLIRHMQMTLELKYVIENLDNFANELNVETIDDGFCYWIKDIATSLKYNVLDVLTGTLGYGFDYGEERAKR